MPSSEMCLGLKQIMKIDDERIQSAPIESSLIKPRQPAGVYRKGTLY